MLLLETSDTLDNVGGSFRFLFRASGDYWANPSLIENTFKK